MEVGNITKATTFKSFLHQAIKTHNDFLVTVLFNIFMRQTLTDYFWGLHKNMNCTFPLTKFSSKHLAHLSFKFETSGKTIFKK